MNNEEEKRNLKKIMNHVIRISKFKKMPDLTQPERIPVLKNISDDDALKRGISASLHFAKKDAESANKPPATENEGLEKTILRTQRINKKREDDGIER